MYCSERLFRVVFITKMSFIQFESGREKDKMREELREARNDLLKQVNCPVIATKRCQILFQLFCRLKKDQNCRMSVKYRNCYEETINGCYLQCQKNSMLMQNSSKNH